MLTKFKCNASVYVALQILVCINMIFILQTIIYKNQGTFAFMLSPCRFLNEAGFFHWESMKKITRWLKTITLILIYYYYHDIYHYYLDVITITECSLKKILMGMSMLNVFFMLFLLSHFCLQLLGCYKTDSYTLTVGIRCKQPWFFVGLQWYNVYVNIRKLTYYLYIFNVLSNVTSTFEITLK